MANAISTAQDFGNTLTTGLGAFAEDVVAAGAGDNTEVEGDYFDILGNNTAAAGTVGVVPNVRFESCALVIAFRTTLSATETLTLKNVRLQMASPDSSGDPDAATLVTVDLAQETASKVIATGPAGGGTVTGTVQFNFFIGGALQFVRAQWTPDLSAGATDVADLQGVMIYGGSATPVTSGKA